MPHVPDHNQVVREEFTRQAVAYAIDKEELSKATTGGQGKPVSAGFPAGMPFHGAVHAQDPYAKPDLQKAKQLIQEAGYKGQEVVLTAHLVPDRIAQGAVVLQSQLQSAGFNVKVLTLESAALQETNCLLLLAELGRAEEALERAARLAPVLEARGDTHSLCEVRAVDLVLPNDPAPFRGARHERQRTLGLVEDHRERRRRRQRAARHRVPSPSRVGGAAAAGGHAPSTK